MRSNKLIWQQRWKDSCYSGSTATAGDLVFTGRNDGRFVALDSRNGDVLWEFQTGAGVNASASVFQFKGHQKVGLFSLEGRQPPSDPPQVLAARATAVTLQGGNPAAGAVVFAQVCAACHGEEGKGGHGGGPNITQVTALELVANTVIAGKNNMPPFAASLTFAQIRDVAAFVAAELGKSEDGHKNV